MNCLLISPLRISKGIFVFSLLLTAMLARAQPKAVWDSKKIDFGTVPKGKVVTAVYTVTNTGTAPLVLERGDVSCSCTTVDFTDPPIAPGRSGTVTVVFNTASAYGRQDRIVLFYTNAEEAPIKLRYKGTVKEN